MFQISSRVRGGRVMAAAVACALTLTACGTRLTDTQIASGVTVPVSQNGLGAGSGNGTGNVPLGDTANNLASGGSASGGTTGGGTTGGGAVGGGTLKPGTSVGGGTTSRPGGTTGGSTGGTSGGTTGGTAGGTTGTGRTGATGVTTGGTSGGTTTAASAPCTAQGAPIVIGQDGEFSGVVGGAVGRVRTGLSVWTQWVNANGGIQCHPVQLYQTDNGSDPSKAASNVQSLAKDKKAVAIVGETAPVVASAADAAATQLHIPIVGGDLSDTVWTTSPNMFQQGGSTIPQLSGAIRQAARDRHLTKLGSLYCVEATICGYLGKNTPTMAKLSGTTAVFSQTISLTQSDFTAECQSAKNAGVQILFVAMTGGAMQRLALNCKSIGYKPTIATAGLAASADALNDPNIRADGLYVGTNQVPYVATGTPALNDFHQAYTRYTGGEPQSHSDMIGWTSGMLFKAAIDSLGAAARQGPITTAMVYQGLYNMHNQTLGGLIPPISFTKGQPSGVVSCGSSILVSTNGITSPLGNKVGCF